MYWLDKTSETDPLSLSTTKGTVDFFKDLGTSIKTAFDYNTTEKFFLKLEQDARAVNAKISNQFTANVPIIEKMIASLYEKNVALGFEYKDTTEYLSTISTELGRMVSFTEDNTKNAIMMSKAMGVSTTETAKMLANLLKAGMSQASAKAQLEKIFITARKYGVDAATLTKTVTDNIFKAQLYGFKDGVDGLTKMAIQAQRVGISMDVAEKAASKAFDPDQAIEMASSLQMLGGAGGAMGDVFGLMYDAQSDIGSLNDKILKSTASMVDFNSKTGEFKINPEMRRNMTQYAEAIGSTYEEVAKNATKYRKEQEIMSKIPLSAGYSEEDKSLISSLAEIGPNGKVQVTIPGTDELKDVTSLTTGEIKKLKDYQKEADKTPEQIARDQLSVLKNVSITLQDIKLAGVRGGLKSTDIKDRDGKIIGSQSEFEKINKYMLDRTVKGGDENPFENLKGGMTDPIKEINKAFIDSNTVANNILKTTMDSDELSTALENLGNVAVIGAQSVTLMAQAIGLLLTNPDADKVDTFTTSVTNFTNAISEAIKGIPAANELIEGMGDFFNKIKTKVTDLKKISDVLAPIVSTTQTPNPSENLINPIANNQTSQNITNILANNQTPQNQNSTQNFILGGEGKVTLEIKSVLSDEVLNKIIENDKLSESITAEVKKLFGPEYSQSLINPIPFVYNG
jgi:hypothetical protein